MKLRNIRTTVVAVSCAATMSASALTLVDRGLPTANLNNAAGANRSNIAWAFGQYTPSAYWLVGDTFQNTSLDNWTINTIRLWTLGQTDTAILRGGIEGQSIGIASTTYSISAVTYAGGVQFQAASGTYPGTMHQVDFTVNLTLTPGQTYDFFLDGTGNSALDPSNNPLVVPYVLASNGALSGSPQNGADNLMLYAQVVNGSIANGAVGAWNSDGDGWDRPSDVNVQVFGTAIPEPTTTTIAGAFLLLWFVVASRRTLPTGRTA